MIDTGRLENVLMHYSALNTQYLLETAVDFWHAQTRAAWALQDLEDVKGDMPDDAPQKDEALFWSSIVIVAETKYVIERDG
jgi:hypothetical protein